MQPTDENSVISNQLKLNFDEQVKEISNSRFKLFIVKDDDTIHQTNLIRYTFEKLKGIMGSIGRFLFGQENVQLKNRCNSNFVTLRFIQLLSIGNENKWFSQGQKENLIKMISDGDQQLLKSLNEAINSENPRSQFEAIENQYFEKHKNEFQSNAPIGLLSSIFKTQCTANCILSPLSSKATSSISNEQSKLSPPESIAVLQQPSQSSSTNTPAGYESTQLPIEQPLASPDELLPSDSTNFPARHEPESPQILSIDPPLESTSTSQQPLGPLVNSYTNVDLTDEISDVFPTDKIPIDIMQMITHLKQELKILEKSASLFSDPNAGPPLLDRLIKIQKTLTAEFSEEFRDSKEGQLLLVPFLRQYVALHDRAIRSVIAASDWKDPDKDKILLETLQEYQAFSKVWGSELAKITSKSAPPESLVKKQIQTIMDERMDK